MKRILNMLVANILVQNALGGFISLRPHEDTKNFTTTTTELLSSFKNCIVYIFDWAYKSDYDSLSSTRYIRFYSENMNCAVFKETYRQYRNTSFNDRFDKPQPHPLLTKYTTTLTSLYTPDTTSTILKKVNPIKRFYNVLLDYNIPFNYIVIFMTNEEFSSIDNASLFCKLSTVSSPAVFLLSLDEREVNLIGFAHAFQSSPFLFKVTKFQEADIQQLHQIIHTGMHGAIASIFSVGTSRGKCRFGAPILTHPHFCALEVISRNLNITFLNQQIHPQPKLSVSKIVVAQLLNFDLLQLFSRYHKFCANFVTYGVHYEEPNFICIAKVNTVGLMAFIQCFDLLTWIIAATVCLCLSTAIAGMATKATASFWNKLQSSVPVVAMLLIERFYGYGQVIRSASRQIGLVISLWAFGAMLLGMSYSGNMITELTSPYLPSCPHGLAQLAQIEDYPILTDMEIDENGVRIPLFQSNMNGYSAEYTNKSGSLTIDLRQFLDSLTFVGDDFTQLVRSNQNSSSKILLAFVGLKEHVSAHAMWIMTGSSKLRVLRGGNLPPFNTLAPILVQSNFFGPIFQRILGNLCQCGIYRYWTDGFSAQAVSKALKVLNQRQKISSWVELLRKSNLALVWRNVNPDLMMYKDTGSGITLENLSAAFQVFGICMLLALCVFIKEGRMFQLVVHHLFKMAKNILTVMNGIVDNFGMLLRMVINRTTFAVNPEAT